MTTLTTIDNLLKVLYLPGLRENLNLGNPLLAQLMRNEESVVGKNFTIGIHAGLNQGIGAAAENAALPDPGSEDYRQAIVPARYNYGRLRLTGQAIAATRSNIGAFADYLQAAIRGVQESLKRDINRQLFGTGSSQLCLVNGAVAGSTAVTVDNGISAADGISRRIYPNMLLDIWNGTTEREAQAVKVVSTTGTTALTLSENVDLTTDDIICRAGARNSSGGLEMMGIDLICDSAGALQGMNPATAGEEFWSANEVATNGAQTLAAMLGRIDAINTDSGEDPNLIVTTKGGRRAYFDLFDTQIDFQPQVIKGGYKVLTFAGGNMDIPILVDDDCPATNWYYLNTGHIAFYQMADWAWMERDGSRLQRVQDRDAYEATLFIYSNLGTDFRAAHGKQTAVTEG